MFGFLQTSEFTSWLLCISQDFFPSSRLCLSCFCSLYMLKSSKNSFLFSFQHLFWEITHDPLHDATKSRKLLWLIYPPFILVQPCEKNSGSTPNMNVSKRQKSYDDSNLLHFKRSGGYCFRIPNHSYGKAFSEGSLQIVSQLNSSSYLQYNLLH